MEKEKQSKREKVGGCGGHFVSGAILVSWLMMMKPFRATIIYDYRSSYSIEVKSSGF